MSTPTDMKARQKAPKTMKTIRTRRRRSLTVRLLKASRRPKEPTLLQKIAQMSQSKRAKEDKVAKLFENQKRYSLACLSLSLSLSLSLPPRGPDEQHGRRANGSFGRVHNPPVVRKKGEDGLECLLRLSVRLRENIRSLEKVTSNKLVIKRCS